MKPKSPQLAAYARGVERKLDSRSCNNCTRHASGTTWPCSKQRKECGGGFRGERFHQTELATVGHLPIVRVLPHLASLVVAHHHVVLRGRRVVG
jgi:hypothetical protein